MKQKLTALSLEQLAKEMPVISEQEQQAYWGGGTGTKDDPYTYQEYSQMLDSGTWSGGYVLGVGESGALDTESPSAPINGAVYLTSEDRRTGKNNRVIAYKDFEEMAIVGSWQGGLVRMRDGSIQYLDKDAQDDDGIINRTGDYNRDFMYTAGYKAGMSTSAWDDIWTLGSGVGLMMISGSENWAVWDSGAGRLDRLNAARGNKNK